MSRFITSAATVRGAVQRGLLPVLLVAGLSACSLLPASDPVDSYLLPHAPSAPLTPVPGSVELPSAPDAADPLPVSLRVTRPVTGVLLSGQRMVVIPDQHRAQVYHGSQWSEPVPLLLRKRLSDAFRIDGRIGMLSNDEIRLRTQFELISDLRAFHVEYVDGTPQAVISLEARLVRTEARRMLDGRLFEARVAATGSSVPEVVDAMGHAANALAGSLVSWTVEGITRSLKQGEAEDDENR